MESHFKIFPQNDKQINSQTYPQKLHQEAAYVILHKKSRSQDYTGSP